MEQFFQGRNKIFRKNVQGTKIFTENFVPPERNSSDSATTRWMGIVFSGSTLSILYSLFSKPQNGVYAVKIDSYMAD